MARKALEESRRIVRKLRCHRKHGSERCSALDVTTLVSRRIREADRAGPQARTTAPAVQSIAFVLRRCLHEWDGGVGHEGEEVRE